MSELTFTTRGIAEVLAAQEKLAEQMGKQKSAAAQLNQEYKANQAELNKLGRIAQAIFKENETAVERYNRKMEETKGVLQGNANEAELLKRQTTQLRLEYLRSVDTSDKLTQAQRRELEIKRERLKVLRSEGEALAPITSETQKLLGTYTETGAELGTIATKQESAFGEAALAKVVAFGAGLVTVGKVVSAISQGMAEVNRKIDEAANATFQAQGAIGALQTASGTPAEFQKNLGFARELVRRGIVDPNNVGQAADITTGLVRAHISDKERGVLADLADKDFIKETQMEGVGVGAKSIQEIFGTKAGSFDKVLYQLLAASRYGKLDPEELANVTQKFGAGAVGAGVPLDRALATVAVISRTAPTAKLAASRTQKYFEGLGKGENPLSPEQTAMLNQILPSITGAAAPANLASTDPRNFAGQALEAEQGAYADQTSNLYERRRQLAKAAYTARMRDASSRGTAAWAMQGALEWTVGSLIPDDYNMSLPDSATPDTKQAVRAYQGYTGTSMDDLAKASEESNKLQQEQLNALKDISNKLGDGGIPVGAE